MSNFQSMDCVKVPGSTAFHADYRVSPFLSLHADYIASHRFRVACASAKASATRGQRHAVSGAKQSFTLIINIHVVYHFILTRLFVARLRH